MQQITLKRVVDVYIFLGISKNEYFRFNFIYSSFENVLYYIGLLIDLCNNAENEHNFHYNK